MGRRKSKLLRRDPNAKLRRIGKLDKEFNCPFCNHDKTVEIKISQQKGIAILNCRVCTVNFSMEVTHLDEAVDVYSEWIDRCREANDGNPQRQGLSHPHGLSFEGSGDYKGEGYSQDEVVGSLGSHTGDQKHYTDVSDAKDFELDSESILQEGERTPPPEDDILYRKRLHKNAIGNSLFDDD